MKFTGDVTTSASATTSSITAANVDLNAATRTFTVADGGAATDLQVGAVLTNGNVTKAGAGTMTLTQNNTYTGTTTVSGGTLQL